MADRIRKFGQWLWMNKERMVLIVMLGVLVYQVYQVFYPPPPPQETQLEPPATGTAHLPPEAKPPTTPDAPSLLTEGQYAGLYRNNPFWMWATGGAGNSGDDIIERIKKNVRLVDVMVVGTRTRARIQTPSTTRWYDVGDKFEEYTLESIDSSANSAVIFAESAEKRVTIEEQQ